MLELRSANPILDAVRAANLLHSRKPFHDLPVKMNAARFRGQMGAAAFSDEGVAPPQSLAQLAQYGVFSPDQIVAIRQPLYDRLVYDDAGIAGQMRFFQQQLGTGNSSAIGGTGQVKTLDDTNMVAAGQLPAPQAFLATSVEVIAEPGSISTANAWSPLDPAFIVNTSAGTVATVPAMNGVNDVSRILIGAWLRFEIGSAEYLTQSRLDSFPAKSFVAADTSTAMSGNLGVAGIAAARAVGKPFYLNPPLLLLPNVNFVVTLNWNNAVATPTGMNARITVRLDGILYRKAQ